MARFGQAFINQLTNPSYSQGMFNLGATIGSAPAVAAERKSKEERQKGLLGGLMAIEQAAQQGSLTDDMLKEAAGSLSGLGLPADKVMGVISNARQLQNQALKSKKDQLKFQGAQSLAVAQRVFASEQNAENLPVLTRSIEQLALQTGNDPIEAVKQATEARKKATETKETAIKEGFKTAYYASLNTPEQNALLLDNMRKSGFSDLALDLETKNEDFIRLRDQNIKNQEENKPLTEQEITKLNAQVALIDDEPVRKRYEAAVNTLSVVSANTPSKARTLYGQLLTSIAQVSPEKPTKEKVLPDPSEDEIQAATAAINQRRSNAPFADETALGSVTIEEQQVLVDDILDGDVEGVSVDEVDLARIVAAQQKQNPEINIDTAIKRAIESLVLGKKIVTQATTGSNSDDDIIDYGSLKQ